MAIGCKNEKPAKFTILGDYTSYGGFIEKMNGKVKQVVERVYWAEADRDTFKKGNLITIKERDSLKYYYDYEANFDSVGDLISCNYLDENNKIVGSYQFSKENNKLASVTWTYKDTIREYQKLKCNEKGIIIEATAYNPNVDTLMYSWTVDYNKAGDTVLYMLSNSKGIHDTKVLNLYNEKGKFVSYETYDKDGVLTASDKVIYNDKGKMSEATFYGKDKKIEQAAQRTYPQYDDKDNWVIAITKENKHTMISERSYSYFK
jgi:hypothetical protein